MSHKKIIEIETPKNLSIARSIAPEKRPSQQVWWRWLSITHYQRIKANGY